LESANQDAMLFCTQHFLYFFLAVFTLYWLLPFQRVRVWLLLGASLYFYASWNPLLAGLILVSATLDFGVARALEAERFARWRRVFLAVSLAANFGLLVYFKYANFFLDSLGSCLRAVGLTPSLPALSVIVPVGISFYTFEAVSYTVDVFRRRIRAERRLTHFLLFILFFPHLVAGPIVRASDFLPQVRRPKRWNWVRFALGGRLILLGLFKKLAIADRMALLVDPVFADPKAYGGGALWMAAVGFAFQLYCDFSGYSDLALGTAHMLGYRLAPNFDMPFLARNVAEFWRRWHISLSNWIRDYVFLPLGGSRRGRWRTAGNLLAAMTLCGLWHGANWSFVAWGAVNGVFMIVHRVFRSWARRRPRLDGLLLTAPGTAFCVALTFTTFVLAMVLFRAPSLSAGAAMLGWLFAPGGCRSVPAPPVCFWATAAVLLAAHLTAQAERPWRLWQRLPSWAHGAACAAFLIVTLLLAPVKSQVFLYFQF
jgi:alginate O-acetyltransferase complex protein AlgI